ncbi:MAG TPA: NAD(P)H-hydrate dehydratase [Candidatus Limnocylindrales bacterium]|nr:NAD(P)H-hydrate dehydratase [Candidatus Limnocylindrales bacterium]
MKEFDPKALKNLYAPPSDSHKGENGKLMLIGGSHLFHAASLWALTIASKFVDMVFYSSVPENNEIVQKAKEEFRNGIVVPRGKIDDYAAEADCILIGPGLPRPDGHEEGDDHTKELTEKLFIKYPDKKWVIDGGSLQVINPEIIPKNSIITPHRKEFETLFGMEPNPENAENMAKKYGIIILLKGESDIVCNPEECVEIVGGNAGMTKGGTGDVLAGLVAALACKNDLFLAALVGSYINKKAGESLYGKVGYNFNASDLAEEIPIVMEVLQKS